ncbi:MAG: hypothetical protein VX615_01590 [Planctomycetota bacterium]|nr:hypothetical protein [Planctomycetota bacterium]
MTALIALTGEIIQAALVDISTQYCLVGGVVSAAVPLTNDSGIAMDCVAMVQLFLHFLDYG